MLQALEALKFKKFLSICQFRLEFCLERCYYMVSLISGPIIYSNLLVMTYIS